MGRFTREEIDTAFKRYQEVGLTAARSGDWKVWGSIFTEDCGYWEHSLGQWGGRDAVAREMGALMHKTEGTPWIWVNQYPVDAYVIDEDRGWVWSLIWNRMEDAGDGLVRQCPCLTLLHYAGDGLFSFEEDLYDPNQFLAMMDEWVAVNERCKAEETDRNTLLEARRAAATEIALEASPEPQAPKLQGDYARHRDEAQYAGRFSTEELDEAFGLFRRNLALAAKTNDWRHFGASLTPDATVVDCELGPLGKREAIVREIESHLHRTDPEEPWACLNVFAPGEYVIDEKAGEVWAFFWPRFRDPGDGSRHESKAFVRLRYGGEGLWAYMEVLYNPTNVKAAMASWVKAKAVYDERRERRAKRLAEREAKARAAAPLKLDGDV